MLLRNWRIAASANMANVIRKVIPCENEPERLSARREARPAVQVQPSAARASSANVERSTAIVARGAERAEPRRSVTLDGIASYGRYAAERDLDGYTKPLLNGMTTPMFTTYLLMHGLILLGEVWVHALHIETARRKAEKYACTGCGEVEDCSCITVSPVVRPFGFAL